jgi:Bacterial Ig domain/CHRD domain
MRDTVYLSGAWARVTLLTAGAMSVILAACGGYGGSSSYGGGGMSCGGAYGTMCPAPTVKITAPANNMTVSGTVALTATASASSTYNLTVKSVVFMVDTTTVGTGTASGSSYTFMWNSAGVTAGSHTVTATVTDSAGGTATNSVMITTTGMAAAAVAMTAAEIFPAPMSQGMGVGNMSVRFETGAVRGTIKLAAVNATAVSINQGFAGTTGPAVIRLAPSGGNRGEWQVPAGAVLTAEQLRAFSQGQLYVIATSAKYPRGEVRGQIVPAGVAVTFSTMTPVHDAQSLGPGAAGVIATTVDKNALTLSVHVNSNGVEDADAARVVSSATGRTLAVLAKDPVDMGHWSTELAAIGAAEVQHFEAGHWNVSIATPVETRGALQGAISPEAH